MPFTIVSLGSRGDTAARSNITCSVFRAPAANTLILVSVMVSDAAGTPVEPSFVSGSGLIFSLITSSVTYNTAASALHNLSIWRGMGAGSIVSSVITANFSNNNTGCAMIVDEISGVSTSGTSGSGAVGKSATSRVDGVVGLSVVTVLAPSATSTANAWYAVGGLTDNVSGNSCGVSDQKFTLISPLVTYATPNTAMGSAWTTISSCNSVACGGGAGNVARAGIMVELVLDNPAAGGARSPYYSHYYQRVVCGEAA